MKRYQTKIDMIIVKRLFLLLPVILIFAPFSFGQSGDVFEGCNQKGSLKVEIFGSNLRNIPFLTYVKPPDGIDPVEPYIALSTITDDTSVCVAVANRKEDLDRTITSDVFVYVVADNVLDEDFQDINNLAQRTKNLLIVLDSDREGHISDAFEGFDWKYIEDERALLVGGIKNIPVISPASNLSIQYLVNMFRTNTSIKVRLLLARKHNSNLSFRAAKVHQRVLALMEVKSTQQDQTRLPIT